MISIIIPSRTDEYCERLLQSLRENGGFGQRLLEEYIVVDSGLSADFRQRWKNSVRFVPTQTPFNFSRAINDGVQVAIPQYPLLLINDDCAMLTYQFVEKLTALLRDDAVKNYGIISLKIAEGGVGNDEQRTIPDGTLIRETKRTVCFVAPLIRRATWDAVGPMDEFFVGSFGDDDYNFRARAAGWKCGVTGLVSVRHGFPERSLGNSFLRYMKPSEHQAHSRAARDYFLRKHGSLPDPAHYKL